MPQERICRGCEKTREPPIEGPCPHCRGYFRTILKRARRGAEEGDELPDGPVPVGELLDHAGGGPEKQPTGLAGLDHVFGGGLPETGTVLFCGQEGSGKTSLLVELLLTVRLRSLLLSTEQGKEDLIAQFGRFGEDRLRRASRHMFIESEIEFPEILACIEKHRPRLLALDSLHNIEDVRDDHGRPMTGGGDRAVTRAAKILGRLSRELGFFAFLVGHMGNDGNMMGGAHLRHEVDGTLVLRRRTRRKADPRRVLRFRKFRFAPLGREALFQMTNDGFKDCGPILDEEEADEAEPAPPPKAPRRPREDGQLIRFPGKKRPVKDDGEEPPEPPQAA